MASAATLPPQLLAVDALGGLQLLTYSKYPGVIVLRLAILTVDAVATVGFINPVEKARWI